MSLTLSRKTPKLIKQMTEYPSGTCQTEDADNGNSIQCDLCDKWYHTICVDVSDTHYEKLKVDPNPWFNSMCAKEIPFFVI